MQLNCNSKNGSVVNSNALFVHATIYRWVNKFRTHQTLQNLKCKNTNKSSHSRLDNQNCSGHHATLRLPKTLLFADRSPSKSVLRRSQELEINRKTVRRLLSQRRSQSLEWLEQGFPDRLISCRCDPEWSPHSPDLISQIFICGDTL